MTFFDIFPYVSTVLGPVSLLILLYFIYSVSSVGKSRPQSNIADQVSADLAAPGE